MHRISANGIFCEDTTTPSVPILCSKSYNNPHKKMLFYIGDVIADLGIMSGRLISEEGIKVGSVLDWVEYAQSPEAGWEIAIGNPGQLVWHRRSKKAMTWSTWNALDRPSALSPSNHYTEKNKIPQHGNPGEHIRCLLQYVIVPSLNAGRKDGNAVKLGIVVESGCSKDLMTALYDFYKKDEGNNDIWAGLKHSISIAFTGTEMPLDPHLFDDGFQSWWNEASFPAVHGLLRLYVHQLTLFQNARGYVVSHLPQFAPLPEEDCVGSGCALFSSGEPEKGEHVFPHIYKHVIDDLGSHA